MDISTLNLTSISLGVLALLVGYKLLKGPCCGSLHKHSAHSNLYKDTEMKQEDRKK